MQYERYMQPESPPCVWLQAPVALLALLRDPGERAQSAFHFGLQARGVSRSSAFKPKPMSCLQDRHL